MFYELRSLKQLMSTNAFINFLSKLPGLKILSFKKLYKNTGLKKILSVFGFLFELIKETIIPSIFTALIFWRLFVRLGIDNISVKLLSYILIAVIASKISKPTFLIHNEDDYIFLNLFSINSRVYYLNKIFSNIVISILANFPAIYYVFQDLGIALKLSVLNLASMILVNMIYLTYIKKRETLPKSEIRALISALFVILGGLVIFLRIDLNLNDRILNILAIVSAVISIFGIAFILRYKNYPALKRITANSSGQVVKMSVTTTINEDSSQYLVSDAEEIQNFQNKYKDVDPAKYIDMAFFSRYKKVFKKNLRSNFSGSIAILIIYSIAIKIGIIKKPQSFSDISGLAIAFAVGTGYSAALLQMCFRNVDRILLKNKILTEQGLYESLKYRIRMLIKASFFDLLSVGLGFLILIFLNGLKFEPVEFARIMAAYLAMMASMGLVEIMVYYIFSPYSAELNVKSPAYKVVRFISGLVFALFILKNANILNIEKYIYIAFGVTVLIFLFAKKYFIRTFRLRY
ncbi:hypothetical protein HMPREF1634_03650 [Tissierellia bacterium S7-1-4]|nr:hypothetical protein HMPREF1634_03650 [Tissierellia bacterium S7-1-4]